MTIMDSFKVVWPEAEHGDCRIERFEVTKHDADLFNLRAIRDGRFIEPGTYTRLLKRGQLWMSDTPAEIQDHLDAYFIIKKAKARTVLVTGLGLGCFTHALLQLDHIEHVGHIELDPDVIQLVGGFLKERYGDRVSVTQGCALTGPLARPPNSERWERWDFVWHDIWPSVCGDNWDEYKRMHRRYGRLAKRQDSWCRNFVRRMAQD